MDGAPPLTTELASVGRCSLEIRRKRTLTGLERVANTYGKGHWSIILHGLRYEFLHSAPIPTRAVTGMVIMMQHLQYSTLRVLPRLNATP